MGTVIGERYVVDGVLGSGGAGVILACADTRIGKKVAIKLLQPRHRGNVAARARLEREARLGARFGHQHVCAVTDSGALPDGSPFVVLERLNGVTIETALARSRVFTPREAIRIALQMLSALASVHAEGVIHRDLKPGNVFLVSVDGLPPAVKIMDFGTALTLDTPEDEMLTDTGFVVGTPDYLSPEQVSGRRDLDARIDVYQVGVLLYEMLSGHRPFDGKSIAEVMRAIRNGGARPLSSFGGGASAALEGIVARAMAVPREARFQSAMQMLEALSEHDLDAVEPRPVEAAAKPDVAAPDDVDTDVSAFKRRFR